MAKQEASGFQEYPKYLPAPYSVVVQNADEEAALKSGAATIKEVPSALGGHRTVQIKKAPRAEAGSKKAKRN